jgi:hypothetical protein
MLTTMNHAMAYGAKLPRIAIQAKHLNNPLEGVLMTFKSALYRWHIPALMIVDSNVCIRANAIDKTVIKWLVIAITKEGKL